MDTAPDFKEVGSDQGLVAAVERFRYFLSFQTSPTKENPKGSLYFGADAAEYYLDVADKNDLAKTLVEDDLTKLKTFMWLLVATQRKRLDALSMAGQGPRARPDLREGRGCDHGGCGDVPQEG